MQLYFRWLSRIPCQFLPLFAPFNLQIGPGARKFGPRACDHAIRGYAPSFLRHLPNAQLSTFLDPKHCHSILPASGKPIGKPAHAPALSFIGLPTELKLEVLNAGLMSWSTHRALLLVSRDMAHLAKAAIPYDSPVVLTTDEQLFNFLDLVLSNSSFAQQIKSLCLTSSHEQSRQILATCRNLESLFCPDDTLIRAICSSSDFQHYPLKYITLSGHVWVLNLLQSPHASRLFERVTHLRLVNTPFVEKQVEVVSLLTGVTHLCLSWITTSAISGLLAIVRLQSIVIVMSDYQRRFDLQYVKMASSTGLRAALSQDARVELVYEPEKGWNDLLLWKQGRTIWDWSREQSEQCARQ